MQNVSKFVIQAVIVGLCALLASIIFYVYRTGNFNLNEMITRFDIALNSAGEPSFSKYAGKYVDGKTVRSVMEEFGGDYFIRVRTKTDGLSFCLYEKPYKHLVNDGNGSYYDYTKSDSLFYVNENSLYFSTPYRNEGGTVTGILFEEQDSGSISGTVAKLYGAVDLLEAKQLYLQEVKEKAGTMNSMEIDRAIDTAGNAIADIEDEIERLLKSDTAGDGETQETADRYSEKRDALDAASKNMEDAWEAYQEAFKNTTGLESLGHYDITTNGISNEYNDLQYWMDKFSGKSSGSDSESNPEDDSGSGEGD